MGQKIHPTGFRLAVTRNWASRWYANNRDFAGMLAEDIKVREYLKAKLKNAAVARVLIERPAKNARITIFSARPGVVIGKKGEDIESLKREGRVPLHTLRADIDYGTSEAKTTYGVIGVKVWVYKGDTLGRNDAPALAEPRQEEERRPRGPRRDARPGDRPPARGAPRRAGGTNTAPVDGSDKPAEAGGDVKPTVKRVRKVVAPAAAADGAKGE